MVNSRMPDSVTVFQCSVCESFFEDYTVATTHLALSHPNALMMALSSSTSSSASSKEAGVGEGSDVKKRKGQNRQDSGKIDRGGVSLIESCVFARPNISLKRVDPDDDLNLDVDPIGGGILSEKVSNTNGSTNFMSNGTATTLSNGKIEIKLDTLKASEMEALIKDLFQSQKNQSKGTVSLKKTNIQVNTRKRDRFSSGDIAENRNKARKRRQVAEAYNCHPELKHADTKSTEDNGIEHSTMSNDDIEKYTSEQSTLKIFSCGTCSKTFPTLIRKVEHERIHASGTKFNCPDCPKTYANNKSLRKHMRQHHPQMS